MKYELCLLFMHHFDAEVATVSIVTGLEYFYGESKLQGILIVPQKAAVVAVRVISSGRRAIQAERPFHKIQPACRSRKSPGPQIWSRDSGERVVETAVCLLGWCGCRFAPLEAPLDAVKHKLEFRTHQLSQRQSNRTISLNLTPALSTTSGRVLGLIAVLILQCADS